MEIVLSDWITSTFSRWCQHGVGGGAGDQERAGGEQSNGKNEELDSQMGEVADAVAAIRSSVEGTARSSWTHDLGVQGGGWNHNGCQR